MTPERWQQIEKLFHAARERQGDERAAFVDQVCGEDASLRREVESLLAQSEKAGNFMSAPPVDQAIRLLADERLHSSSRPTGASEAASVHDAFFPQLFGPYRILRLLGKGGMGEVYEAEDSEGGRHIALKVLSHSLNSTADRARFLREGRLAASISHPHTIYVYGTEEIDGTPVIAMELVPGGTLKDRVKARGPLSPAEAVDVILQLISGLDAAAAGGVLHRDVKPSNCFVDSDGHVKVGDFGLSISTLARDETHLTITGTVLGTPAFASPEQLRGDELDVRSDIYSVGATLYYLLTAKAPFEESNVMKLLTTIVEAAPPSPRNIRPNIPEGLAAIVLRCLEKDRGHRFPNYTSLARELEPFSSAAMTPATLGLRMLAGVIDSLLVGLLTMSFTLFYWGPRISQALTDRSIMLLSGFAGTACSLLYFGILEGFWGASVGKAIFRLRVVGPDRQLPGFLRALLRAFIYLLFYQLPGPVFIRVFAPQFTDWLPGGRVPFLVGLTGGFLPLVTLALLFSTVRRNNGFAGIHELISKTRVILRSPGEVRAQILVPREAAVPSRSSRWIGPYRVPESPTENRVNELVIGCDEKLRRRVWIRILAPGSPPVSPNRRDLSRPGRLRWLTGKRVKEECWDAYEMVEGRPLPAFRNEPQPWSLVRHWLYDLAEELHAGLKDESAPDLALDRVWITADGRAKLLDWPAPGLDRVQQPVSAKLQSMQEFLFHVASFALQGCVKEGQEAAGLPALPLPLHATSFLKRLRDGSFQTSQLLKGALGSLLQNAGVVPRWKRCVHLVLCCIPAALTVAGASAGFIVIARVEAENADLQILDRCLHRLAVLRQEASAEELRERDALETYVAGRFSKIVSDPSTWQNLATRLIVHGEKLRRLAEHTVAAHPNPTDEEVRRAAVVLQPFLEKSRQPPEFWKLAFVMVPAGVVLPQAVLGVLCALLFRQGLLLRGLSLAIVSAKGPEVSRLRALWRAVVAWSPAVTVAVFVWFPYGPSSSSSISSPLLLTVAAAFLVWLIGIVWAVIHPERGLQDRIAGTFLVPK